MKRMFTILIALLLCVSGTAIAITVTNTTTSTVLFFDDFEGVSPVSGSAYPDTSGDYDPVPVVGSYSGFYDWSIYEANGSSLQVTNYNGTSPEAPGACQGDNYFRLAGDGRVGNTAATIAGDFTGADVPAEEIRIEFMVFLPAGAVDNSLGIYVFGSQWGGGHIVQLKNSGGGHILNQFDYYDTDIEDTGLVATLGVWEKWTLDVTVNNANYTLTIGGQAPVVLTTRNGRGVPPGSESAQAIIGVGFVAGMPWDSSVSPGIERFAIDAVPETCADVIARGDGLQSDLNKDCYVTLADLELFASQWLKECAYPDGYMMFRTPLFERADYSRVPQDDEVIDRITLRMAGDEYAPATASLFTAVDLTNVEFTWTALSDGSGHTIEADEIDLRIVEPWGARAQADILATDLRVTLAGWLDDYHTHPRFIPSIAAGSARKLWLLVHAQPAQAAGVYHGSITVAPENKPNLVLPVEVEVLPFDLQEVTRDVGYYYTGTLYQPGQPAPPNPFLMFYGGMCSEESYLKELQAIRRAGCNIIWLHDYANGPLDPTYTNQILTIASNAGFKKVILAGSEHIIVDPYDQGSIDFLRARLPYIASRSQELGFTDVYIYGADEPASPTDQARCIAIADAAHDFGLKSAVAIIDDAYRVPLENIVDMPIMSYLGATTDLPSAVLGMLASGNPLPHEKILYYANQEGDYLSVRRLTFGWYLYKSGFGGHIPWSYYYAGVYLDPFYGDDSDEDYSWDTPYAAFPTNDEPIHSLKFEAGREGITDLRYIEELHRQMVICGDPAKVAQAQAMLDTMLNEFTLVNGTISTYKSSHNYQIPPETYEDFRDQLQDMIMYLR